MWLDKEEIINLVKSYLRLGELPLYAARWGNSHSAAFFVYVLYIDESGDGGSHPDSSHYLVLSGVAMHEGHWRGITAALDALQPVFSSG